MFAAVYASVSYGGNQFKLFAASSWWDCESTAERSNPYVFDCTANK